MELVILLDGSGSVKSENFETLKTWTNGFIENLKVHDYGTRVGVIHFATTVTEISPLSPNVDEIIRKISSITYNKGVTQTGAALKYAYETTFASARANVPKIVLVITDGKTTDQGFERNDFYVGGCKRLFLSPLTTAMYGPDFVF